VKTVPIPVDLLAIGAPVPVNLYSEDDQLLLRAGQTVVSLTHREKLHAFKASALRADADAWQRAYERMVHKMFTEGVALQDIAKACLPSDIHKNDYLVAQQMTGGWLDLQAVLRGILYQGGLSINPLSRLMGIQKKVLEWVAADADDALFHLYQALPDKSLGYCATHALLCAVLCELTAQKLGVDARQRASLMAAALTMNIGMAREQDILAMQSEPVTPYQRDVIDSHCQRSADILVQLEVLDADQIDIVRWHHDWNSPAALPGNRLCRYLLNLADAFVARTAARKTRPAMSAVHAVKSMILNAGADIAGASSAMAQAAGFYPPGTYVRLHGGELAVSAQRGERANMPWVICLTDKNAIPVVRYACSSTADPQFQIRTPERSEQVRIAVAADRVLRARERIPR